MRKLKENEETAVLISTDKYLIDHDDVKYKIPYKGKKHFMTGKNILIF